MEDQEELLLLLLLPLQVLSSFIEFSLTTRFDSKLDLGFDFNLEAEYRLE